MRFATVVMMVLLCVAIGCREQAASSNVGKKTTNHLEDDFDKVENQVVELSCGQCQLGMDGSGCDLAIRINGKSFFADGSSIDDHGDAHADDGLCNCIRKAKVSGHIVDGRFKATAIELLADDKDQSEFKN